MSLPTTQEELDKLLEETVTRKIKGLTKQIEERETKLAEYSSAEAKRKSEDEASSRKKLEEEGKFKELLSAETTERVRATESLTSLQGQHETALGVMQKYLDAELKSLPKDTGDQVKTLLDGLTAIQKMERLPAIKALVGGHRFTEVEIDGASPRKGAPPNPDREIDNSVAKLHARMRGDK